VVLTEKLAARSVIPHMSDLGETPTSYDPPTPNSNFVYGSNKDETQLTIMVKRILGGSTIPDVQMEVVVNLHRKAKKTKMIRKRHG
jgi:hypothetical protein